MQQKDNTGVLFPNHKRKTDKHPNTTGSALIDGVEYWVKGWTNEAKQTKEKYIALKFEPKENQTGSVQKKLNEEEGDIPF